MDDLERAFRDALRRADTVTVPVDIDPREIRSGRPPRRRWLGGLAMVASLTVVAGVGIWAALGRESLPAVPAAPPPVMVEVDLYSGRENPQVALDARTTDQLYDALPGLAATGLELTDLPDPGLGFRGFVVRPPDGIRPVLRILPGTVVVDPAGAADILSDADGSLFAAVAAGLPAELQQQVAALLVQVRVRNVGPVGVTDVRVTFPDNQTIDYGSIEPGGASRYAPVGLAYRYALILATADAREHRWQPIDFMGETPLEPGYYSYAITVDGDRIDLEFSQDNTPPTTSAGTPATPTDPGEPTATPDGGLPAAPGDTATWELMEPAGVGPKSTSLTVGVTRLGCASGVTGAVRQPLVEATADQVRITIGVEQLPPGAYDCQGNDVVEQVVLLPEPLGERDLVDGACLAGEAVGTAACASGPVRRPR